MKEKTHYRKVFKSEHLGVADLEEFIEEGRSLIFTIHEVKQEYNVSVAGRKGNYNIAYLLDTVKPLVLNSTNSKIIKSFNKNSPFVEDWKHTIIELFIDYNVTMKGEKVGGLRIKPVQPKLEKDKPIFTENNFKKAKEAGATIEKIKTVYKISEELIKKYNDYVTKN